MSKCFHYNWKIAECKIIYTVLITIQFLKVLRKCLEGNLDLWEVRLCLICLLVLLPVFYILRIQCFISKENKLFSRHLLCLLPAHIAMLLLSHFSRVWLCDPIDGSPPGSTVSGILQARTLEWVAISFSNAWKWKVKVKSLSRVRLLATPWTVAYQAPLPMGFSRQEYWSGLPLPSPT